MSGHLTLPRRLRPLRYWALNRWDGVLLRIDRLRPGYVPCGVMRDERLPLVCDLPVGHDGWHKSRAFVARIERR